MLSAVEVAKKCPPKIREASLDDYRQIVALQLRNGLAAKSQEEWSALWAENPAYIQSENRVPIGWVLESPAGEVSGFIGNLPLAYQFYDRVLLAACSCSWVVDPQFRSHSTALLDCFLEQKGVDLFISSTLSPAAERVFRAFRFASVPVGAWDQVGFWITDYRGFARSALRAMAVPLPGVLAYPAAAALSVRDLLLKRTKERAPNYKFEFCSGFDARFDDFWEQLKNENRDRLLAVRTRDTLAWHFGQSLARRDTWLLTASTDGRLVAYAVCKRQDQPALGLKRLRFADFQALKGFEDALGPTLGAIRDKCRSEGIHVIENEGCWLERPPAPQSVAPYHRKLKSWAFCYKARNRELSAQLKDPNAWAPSSYDGDASL